MDSYAYLPGSRPEALCKALRATVNVVSMSIPPIKHRILVADDSADLADSVALLLQTDGHEVFVARDGKQAWQIARDELPDIAFIDIGMPVMNGYELAQSIRRAPWGQVICLIAVTGRDSLEDHVKALEMGFDMHWPKPMNMDALDALLAKQAFELRSPPMPQSKAG
jgi:DNA-binding response OmpR family regulator